MRAVLFDECENLLDIRNILSVNRTTQALKRGITQTTVASEFLLDGFPSIVVTSKVYERNLVK